MKSKNLLRVLLVILAPVLCTTISDAQDPIRLLPDVPSKYVIDGKRPQEFDVELTADEVCNLTTDASEDMPVSMAVLRPDGDSLIKEAEPSEGYIFIAEASGTYKIVITAIRQGSNEEIAKQSSRAISVQYSNKFTLPPGAKTASVRYINGYQIKIANEVKDDGKTYLLIQRSGKLKAIMRSEKEIAGGYHFSDDPSQIDGANAKRSAELMRTTADKTGDGTPDIAVEYYTGGAHCCFEITFFELGAKVRQLRTIDTDNDRMTATVKKPEGGLRFQFAEQAFAYWNINFAQSPMPTVMYEFDRSDKLVPRFDLMRKPGPTPAKLKRDAAAMKIKVNLNPYTSSEDNFNDWEEPFWSEMLDLIYTGHEDMAWQYFDLVWPAKKKGKEKFMADFKEQLAFTAYGDWKKSH